MTLLSETPSPRSLGTINAGSLQFGLLGSIQSPRGVQVVAIDGRLNLNPGHPIATTLRAFTHLVQVPAGCTLGVAGQAPRLHPPTNFIGPGIPLETNRRSAMTGAACIFDPGFFAGPLETEDDFRFDGIDYITDIQSERLTLLGRSMFREAVAPGFAASLFAESIGLAILVEIARYDGAARSRDDIHRGGLAAWQMRRLESYVGDHLSADLTLDELARLVGISVRHLSRTVRQEKGVSVHRWIASRRHSEARRLLAETDLPVQDIAHRSAFRNAGAFAAAFRAASGLSPAEFRRRCAP
jgi:AraC-like DNA-binding protein